MLITYSNASSIGRLLQVVEVGPEKVLNSSVNWDSRGRMRLERGDKIDRIKCGRSLQFYAPHFELCFHDYLYPYPWLVLSETKSCDLF